MSISYYPTTAHRDAARAIVDYFCGRPETDAVLLTCSCARGKATPDSCLDIAVLTPPGTVVDAVDTEWQAFYCARSVFRRLEEAGRFAEVHLDIVTGEYEPGDRNWTGGPDSFELEIGNHIAYSVPLWERNDRYLRLRTEWLPYYSDDLRKQRLAGVAKYFHNNLDHIPLYVARGLYFQAFDRLYNAHKEFLQALFISRRTYPIAYDKWIKEQVAEMLGLPDVYGELVRNMEIRCFESDELIEKANVLRVLFERCVDA